MISEQKVQECDATGDDSSTKAWCKKNDITIDNGQKATDAAAFGNFADCILLIIKKLAI